MIAGQLALVVSSVYLGCALYMSLVEQSARLVLDDPDLLKEWKPSDHRAFPTLSILSLLSALLGFIAFFSQNDVRWMVGALSIIATWPYWFFIMAPMSARLYAVPAGVEARQLMRYWGLLEAGLGVISAVAVIFFLWALN